jgi:putative ABC transport system permease protein
MFSLLSRTIRELLQRRRANREVEEELQFHLEMEINANVVRGLSAAEARRQALADLGGVAQTTEAVRGVRASWIDSISQDVRFALRVLRRGGTGWLAMAMLALAIGITAAMFTVVDALLLRTAPFQNPDELAFVYLGNDHGGPNAVAPAVLRAWKQSGVFAAVEAANRSTAVVEMNGSIMTRGLAQVTPGVFEMLRGVRPVKGRLFDTSDGRSGTDDRILISEDMWRDVFGRDPDTIGKSVLIDGKPLVVIGILPAEFRFPSASTVIWRASSFDDPKGTRPVVYVRFRTDLPRADAERIATTAARSADSVTATANRYLRVQPLRGTLLDEYSERAIPLLGGGVVLVFFVLCANVSSLLLARFTARQREFAMRSALGASRARLLRQALVESGLIGILAILAGAGTAWILVALARAFLPEAFLLGTLNPLNLDLRALAVTSAAGVVATAAAGLLPAWIGTRVQRDSPLRVSDRGGTETRAARALARMLLVAELALACTLLTGATLLIRSFVNLANADRGLDPEGIVVARLSVLIPELKGDGARESLARSLEDEVRSLPAVQQMAWSYGLPPGGGAMSFGEWHSDLAGAPALDMVVDRYWVGPEFFSMLDIPILRGRTFAPEDSSNDVVVGERFAAALWPGLDPLGHSFTFVKERFRVIGVAREINYPTLETRRDSPEFYEQFKGVGRYAMAMASIRCAGPCPDPALIRQRLGRVHAAVRVDSVRPLVDSYIEELARPRSAAAVGFAFAAIAVLAAAGGLFSVLSYAVRRRRREFGIRSALGASSSQLAGVVVRDSVTVSLAGLCAGGLASWWIARGLTSLQYGVSATDPVSCAVVISLLAITVALASWWPAKEAMRSDPVSLLRGE